MEGLNLLTSGRQVRGPRHMAARACPDGGARPYRQGYRSRPAFHASMALSNPAGLVWKGPNDGNIKAYRSRTAADEIEDSEKLVENPASSEDGNVLGRSRKAHRPRPVVPGVALRFDYQGLAGVAAALFCIDWR